MKGQKTGGRVKGVPNKTTGAVKDMVLTALTNVGGAKYLETQARENPTAFLTLAGKLIPHEVTGAGGAPLSIIFQQADSRVL